MALVEILLAVNELQVSGVTHFIGDGGTLILTAIWANQDSKSSQFDKLFEFGFLNHQRKQINDFNPADNP